MPSRPRLTPYTEIGISRVPCWRCGAPSWANWQICSDGNCYRGICRECDVALNALVLEFMGDPEREAKMERYRARVLMSSPAWVAEAQSTPSCG